MSLSRFWTCAARTILLAVGAATSITALETYETQAPRILGTFVVVGEYGGRAFCGLSNGCRVTGAGYGLIKIFRAHLPTILIRKQQNDAQAEKGKKSGDDITRTGAEALGRIGHEALLFRNDEAAKESTTASIFLFLIVPIQLERLLNKGEFAPQESVN